MDPYVGEIRIFAGNFAPQDWQLCDGTLLSISSNEALYSLIGTTYGGDGVSTFAVPDLRGRLNVGSGTGTGLTPRAPGQTGGAETVAIDASTMAAHAHPFNIDGATATTTQAGTTVTFADVSGNNTLYANNGLSAAIATPVNPASNTVTPTGGSQSHDNIMPSLAVNYIIALNGIYPSAE